MFSNTVTTNRFSGTRKRAMIVDAYLDGTVSDRIVDMLGKYMPHAVSKRRKPTETATGEVAVPATNSATDPNAMTSTSTCPLDTLPDDDAIENKLEPTMTHTMNDAKMRPKGSGPSVPAAEDAVERNGAHTMTKEYIEPSNSD